MRCFVAEDDAGTLLSDCNIQGNGSTTTQQSVAQHLSGLALIGEMFVVAFCCFHDLRASLSQFSEKTNQEQRETKPKSDVVVT
jgi:hypothetical protein